MIRISSSSSAGIGERLDEREPEDADPVGQRPRPVAPLGERHALVEPEEVGVLGMLVLDRDLEIPDRLLELAGSEATARLDVLLEPQ